MSDLEAGLIGSLIEAAYRDGPHCRVLLAEVLGQLRESDFTDQRHRVAFRAIAQLDADEELPTPLNMVARLQGRTDEATARYVLELRVGAMIPRSVAMQVERMSAMATMRAMNALGHRLAQETSDADNATKRSVSELNDRLRRWLEEAANRTEPGSLRDGAYGAEVVKLVLAGEFAKRAVSSGIRELDEVMGGSGFRPGCLYLFGAWTGVGKGVLATHFAQEARRAGKRVAVFVTEISEDNIWSRLASNESEQHVQAMPYVSDAHRQVMDQMPGWRLKVSAVPFMSVSAIETAVRKEALTDGLDLIVVDHLQTIGPPDGWDRRLGRYAEVNEIAQRLIRSASTLNVPLIVTAQLNPPKAVEGGGKAKPNGDLMRDSKDPVNMASMYAGLYHTYGSPLGRREIQKSYLWVDKSRFGKACEVEIKFSGSLSKVFRAEQEDPFSVR